MDTMAAQEAMGPRRPRDRAAMGSQDAEENEIGLNPDMKVRILIRPRGHR